jgi:hypothetical protein
MNKKLVYLLVIGILVAIGGVWFMNRAAVATEALETAPTATAAALPAAPDPTATAVPSTDSESDGSSSSGSSEAEPTPTEDKKFGYSEEDRMQIYYELGEAEAQAQIDALSLYPTPDPFSSDFSPEKLAEAVAGASSYFSEYSTLFKNLVGEQYNLTPEELLAIGEEGLANNWPLP